MNAENCHDILNEIKKRRPYTDRDAASLFAIKILINEEKIANDPFQSPQVRKNALRRSQCADFFRDARIYYTEQMELEALDNDFSEEKKNDLAVTKENFLKDRKSKIPDLDDLIFRAQERSRSGRATKEEKEMGKEWYMALQRMEQSNREQTTKITSRNMTLDKYMR